MTGSNPRPLPGADFDEKLILSNTGALATAGYGTALGVVPLAGSEPECSQLGVVEGQVDGQSQLLGTAQSVA